MSGVRVSAVPPEHALEVWPAVRAYVSEAVEYSRGRYEPEDILEFVVSGTHTMWIAFEGADIFGVVVTGFSFYPRSKYLHIVLCAGEDGQRWKKPMLKTMRSWAIDSDCIGIEGSGRVGWARIFAPEGAKVLWQAFELPLNEEG